MSYCININHPDYLKLLSESELPAAVLRARMATWMQENNTTEFPSLKDIEKASPLYQLNRKDFYKQKLKRIFFDNIYNKNLTDYDIQRIDGKLREISRDAGDVDYFVRESKAGNLYIAGYKNGNVLSDDYYSPYANGIFRQIKSTNEAKRIKELESKLLSWARAHGISVTSIKDVMAKFPERYPDNAAGIADFAQGLIALADDINIDTIPEEVGHFAVELMLQQKDQGVIDALEQVVGTAEYTRVKEEYKDVYKKEEDFRKEALGKILASEIINQYKLSEQLQEPNNIWQSIINIGTRFTNFIKSLFFNNPAAKTSLQDTVANLATSILKEKHLGIFASSRNSVIKEEVAPFLAQLNNKKPIVRKSALKAKEDFLSEVILQLENRLETFKRSAKSNVDVGKVKSQITKLLKLKEEGQLDLGINAFINQAEGELDAIEAYLKKSLETNSYNTNKLNNCADFITMYDNVLTKLTKDLIAMPEDNAELKSKLNSLAGVISSLESLNFELMQYAAIEILEQGNLDPYGNKIDPDFDAASLVKESFTDIGYWRLYAGNYKYAENSPILKNAHKIVFDAISNTKRFANLTGNELVALQEKFLKEFKVEDLIAKDENGNLTHFFERGYHYNLYYKAMDELKQKIAKELGFENYNDINMELLSKEDKETRSRLWKEFFENEAQQITEFDEDGKPYKKYIPAAKYENTEFKNKMQNPVFAAYHNALIDAKLKAVAKLPIQYRTERLVYMLPGIRKSQIERWAGKGSFLSKVRGLIKDSFFIDEDDTQFGERSKLDNKMVPIFFTRQIELKDLTKDVAKSVTMFAEMAENYQQMNKISGDLNSIQRVLAKREYYIGKAPRKEGIQTKEYAALEDLIDGYVYGIEQKYKGENVIKENKLTKYLGIAGKSFSWSKFANRFAALIRNTNLVGNIPTIVSGFLKGNIDSVIEDQVGIYSTNESKNFARVEFMKNLAQVLGETGKAKQTNVMHLLLQESGVIDLNKMLNETYRGRAARTAASHDILYAGYAQADYALKGRVMISIYDNHRLYNGKFLTRNKFYQETAKEKNVANDKAHQKEVQKQWEELRDKSLYNAYESVNGKLTIKDEFKPYINDAVLNSVRGKVSHVTHMVDGTLAQTDKGKLSRGIAGQFVLMHRGWFVGLVDSRFKKAGVNWLTDEEEIGSHRAFGSMVKNFAVLLGSEGLEAANLYVKNLSPARKRGIKKTIIDLIVLNVVAILAALANMRADDDDEDDWTTQYMAYQLNRLLLEQGAPFSPSELIQIIDEPVVGARFIKSVSEITESFNFSEQYEKGPYEGWSHAKKWWYTKVPGAKNIWELQYPEEKNKFIKQITNSLYYEAMNDKEKRSFLASFVRFFLPVGYFKSNEDKNMEALVEEFEAENGNEPY